MNEQHFQKTGFAANCIFNAEPGYFFTEGKSAFALYRFNT